ncbi:fuconate dehydratase, partial [Microbacterium sp. M1A1_1b]
MSLITHAIVRDIRFPTSRDHDGSDAMNPEPDYSAAFLELRTDSDDGLSGTAFVFTIGRGNDVQTTAVHSVAQLLIGRDAEALLADMGGTWRSMVHDSQLRWLGPEKGVM